MPTLTAQRMAAFAQSLTLAASWNLLSSTACAGSGLPESRCRMVTNCSRVTGESGAKRPLPTPSTILFFAAQITAWVYQVPFGASGTSLKGLAPST